MKRLLLLLLLLTSIMPVNAQDGGFVPFREIWHLGAPYVWDLDWRPDGRTLAVATVEGVTLYDESLRKVRFWEPERSLQPNIYISWSPDGQYLAVGSETVEIWNYPDNIRVAIYDGDFSGVNILWNPHSTKVAFSSYGDGKRQLVLWEFEAEKAQSYEELDPVAWTINTLYISQNRQLMKLWEGSGTTTMIHASGSYDMSASFDDTYFSINEGSHVQIYDENGGYISAFGQYLEHVWSPNAHQLALLQRHRILILNVRERTYTAEILTQGSPRDLRWKSNTDISYVVDNEVLHHDLSTRETLTIIASKGTPMTNYHYDPFPQQMLSWNSDGTKIAVINETRLVIWDVATRSEITHLPGDIFPMKWVEWSNNVILGHVIERNSTSNTFVWDAATYQQLDNFESETTWTVISPDSTQAVSRLEDNTNLQLWDLESRSILAQVTPWAGGYSVIWSPDGDFVLTIGGYETYFNQIFNEKGELIATFQGDEAAAWSPDGQQLATHHNGVLQIRDITTGLPEVVIETYADLMDWHPSEPILATVSGNDIFLWDIDTGQLIQSLTGHLMGIFTISWSPEGQFLASASLDGTVRFWGRG